MPSYDHNKLITRISQIDKVPELDAEYATWIKSDRQLTLLRENAKEDELIISGGGDHTFINTVVVNENNLSPLDKDDLLVWSSDLFSPVASYRYGGGIDYVRIERTRCPSGSKTLEGARQLVFARNFEGLKEKDRLYYEILQEYAHLTEIHWRPEQHAYCRFNENGDFDHIVSIRSKEDKGDVSLVSFKREPLDLYLAASNSVLIRMFDFTLYRRNDFRDWWTDGAENTVAESDILFYRQKILDEHAGYSRGIQIIPPSRPKAEILSSLKARWFGENGKEYVEFIAYDWRNKRITKISTDPTATTKYFQTDGNSLPLEISPAFFRSEILLKYKGDSDKYAVERNNIYCRGGWSLRDYDVNEAGQVHAYICDLRRLPYQEQLYWLSYNEEPKTGISEHSLANHFKNQWVDPDSLEKVVSIVRRWAESDLTWWELREETLLNRVNIPRTSSRDEWAKAFIDLSKLVIEGFEGKAIRKRLEGLDIDFDKKERSIRLLEKFLVGRHKLDDGQKLEGLRTVQHIRSTFVHSSSHDAVNFANDALKEYETYSAHFENVCGTIAHELELIEQAFS